MKVIKKIDFNKRMKKNPDNNFIIQKEVDEEILNNLTSWNDLNWEKASPLTRYEGEAPPIILDNIIEEEKISINASAAVGRAPSGDMKVLTCYLDKASGKWIKGRRVSHPYISVNVTKINPHRNNKRESDTTKLCLMADSGAMCTLLNFETVRSMGINLEKLEASTVCITGVN